MKIFSLETKINLVGWSVGLGFLADMVASRFSNTHNCNPVGLEPGACIFFEKHGWPFRYQLSDIGVDYLFIVHNIVWLNLLFWVLAVFIILFAARYFRRKNYQITSKV